MVKAPGARQAEGVVSANLWRGGGRGAVCGSDSDPRVCPAQCAGQQLLLSYGKTGPHYRVQFFGMCRNSQKPNPPSLLRGPGQEGSFLSDYPENRQDNTGGTPISNGEFPSMVTATPKTVARRQTRQHKNKSRVSGLQSPEARGLSFAVAIGWRRDPVDCSAKVSGTRCCKSGSSGPEHQTQLGV